MKNKNIVLLALIPAVVLLAACASAVPADAAAPGLEEMTTEPDTQVDSAEMPVSAPEQAAVEVEFPEWFGWELTDVNSGSNFSISEHQGEVILVETMAIWCSNCLRQQGEVKRLHTILGEQEYFISLGIDIDPNEDSVALSAFTRQNGFDWLYTVASEKLINEIGEIYGSQFLNPPSTPMLIIDRQGNAHALPFGIKSAEELQSALQPFLDGE